VSVLPASPSAPPVADLRLVREQPLQTTVWLTVVVGAYNHGPFVAACLASIDRAARTTAGIELIVLDDGSQDDTLDRCRQHDFDPGLVLRVYTKPNRGLVHSLRCGLELARGDCVAFIASDDTYADGALEALHQRWFGEEGPPDAALCQAEYFGNDTRGLVYGPEMQRFFAGSASARAHALYAEFPKPMLLQATLFRAAFLRRLGVWSDGQELDDWPTFIRVFAAEAAGQACVRWWPDILMCRYRQHGGGVHHNLQRQLRVTETVARTAVPPAWRQRCLANVRLDVALIHAYQGEWRQALALAGRAAIAGAPPSAWLRLTRRVTRALKRRLSRWSPSGAR
jgi:glycosyltransferase involved in cell wall biosynthesis